VIVDADGGVDLDGVARVSRAVSDVLDNRAAFDGPYVLEVSSPGVDRPLGDPRHWRRAVGRLVKVDADGQSVTGRVLSTDADGVRLDIDGTRRNVSWSALGPGKIQVEFNRADVGGEQERG
jgi:ribosome maturation factor RimP